MKTNKIQEVFKQIGNDFSIFDFCQSLAKKIKAERSNKRLTTQKMAERIQINHRAYEEIETLADGGLGLWRQLSIIFRHWNEFQKIAAILRAIERKKMNLAENQKGFKKR